MQRLNRRQAVLAILLAASVVFLLYSLRGGQPARPQAQARREEPAAPTSAGSPERKLPPAAPADTDFRRYASLASSSIFSETHNAPTSRPGAGKRVLPPPPFPTPRPSPPVPPGPDLTGWSYVGYVTLDDQQLGVLQNDATVSCNFLAVGDNFLGAQVESLDRESIRFSSGSSSTTLSRPRDFPISPLGSGTAASQARPGQPRGQ
jgi:hypothetical protein